MDLGSIGIWSSALRNDGDVSQVAEAAAELEDLGYGALWFPGGPPEGFAERIELLLGATNRVGVASGIASIWTHSASTLASQCALFEKSHPGRFLLGLGVSHAHAVAAAGLQYQRPLSKMVSFLDELDEGSTKVAKDRRILAALGPRMLQLARERSLGAHPYLVNPEHTRRVREAVGHDAIVAPEQMVVLDTNPDSARAVARQGIARYLAAPNYTNNLARLGFSPADIENGGSDRLVDEIVAWGDVGKIMQRIGEHHDAGADHVCVQVLAADPSALPRAQWRALAKAFK